MKPWLRLTLITLTVGGGFTGFVQTLWSLFDPENQESIYTVIMVAFLLLYAFVTLSGLLFVQNQQRIWPLRVALWLQVPWISSSVIAYQFVSGFHVTVGLAGGYLNADSWLGKWGYCGAIILLLTGQSTTRRLILAVAIFALFSLGVFVVLLLLVVIAQTFAGI